MATDCGAFWLVAGSARAAGLLAWWPLVLPVDPSTGGGVRGGVFESG